MSIERLDAATGELVPLAAAGRLSPDEAREWAAWVREVTAAALVKGVDYGIIPGTDSYSLLQPGAEMLLRAAGFGFTITKIEDDDSRAHQGVTYHCTVRRPDDFVVSQCDGYAGYDESRYFRSAETSEAAERARARYDKRPPNERRFVEYRAPWNTLIKMAQKRALVGAVKAAVAGSGLFILTDDNDDDAPPASTPARSTTPTRPVRNEPARTDIEPPF